MRVKKIKVPFYKWEIVSIVIESHDEKEIVVKKMKSLRMRKEDIEEVSDMLDKEASGGGLCLYNTARLLAISIVYPAKTIEDLVGTLIHEGRHATDRIVETTNIEGAEAPAYLTEYVILKMISDYLKKDETDKSKS